MELFLSMCRVNTPPRCERALADRVQPMLEEAGFACVRDSAHDATGGDCGNLIASRSGTVPGAVPIFFSAHFDTVEANPEVQIRVEDGVIRTDGSSILGADDKAGLAAIVEAMRVLAETGAPHGDLQLLLTVSEEIGLQGAANLDFGLVTAKMGFVLDTGPPVGAILTSAPAQDSLSVRLEGRPAHAGVEPEKGISAIRMAARAIETMPLGRIDEETTANVGIILGGEATNVVCPEVRLRAEARSRDNAKLEAQTRRMAAAFEQSASHFGGRAEVQVRRMYDAYRLSEACPVVTIARAAANRMGLPEVYRAAGGGSDANVFNARGLPSCVLGTGMRNIHTREEEIAVADLVKSAEWVLEIARVAAM